MNTDLKKPLKLPKSTDNDIKYLSSARVTVKASATSISQCNIEDKIMIFFMIDFTILCTFNKSNPESLYKITLENNEK
jgi:hypothetical protein